MFKLHCPEICVLGSGHERTHCSISNRCSKQTCFDAKQYHGPLSPPCVCFANWFSQIRGSIQHKSKPSRLMCRSPVLAMRPGTLARRSSVSLRDPRVSVDVSACPQLCAAVTSDPTPAFRLLNATRLHHMSRKAATGSDLLPIAPGLPGAAIIQFRPRSADMFVCCCRWALSSNKYSRQCRLCLGSAYWGELEPGRAWLSGSRSRP